MSRPLVWSLSPFAILLLTATLVGAQMPAQLETPSLDPDKELEKARNAPGGNGGGSGNNVPLPPGPGGRPVGDKGLGGVGGDVTALLAEDPAVTGLIALTLLGSFIAAWRLSSRYADPKEVLKNAQRSMLYGFVKGNPGVHLKQLSGEFGMKTSTVLWHVRKLEAADLVRSKKANGYRVFYPVSGGLEARQLSEAVTALSNDNARRIFESVALRPGAQQRDLWSTLQINPGTIRWHLKKMRDAGLLHEMGPSRAANYFPTDLGHRAFRQVLGLPQTAAPPVAPTAAQAVAEEQPILT